MIYDFCGGPSYRKVCLEYIESGKRTRNDTLGGVLADFGNNPRLLFRIGLDETQSVFATGSLENRVFRNAGTFFDESSELIKFHTLSGDLEVEADSRTRILRIIGGGEDPNPLVGDRFAPFGPYEHNKLGGFPFYSQVHEDVVERACEAMAAGYRHLLQLAFPTPQDNAPKGNWLFGEYVFHLFAKKSPNGGYTYLFCWA